MINAPKTSITAAEAVRFFAKWRKEANSQPVLISHHGKDTHVLLSHDYFLKLTREAPTEAVSADIVSFAEWVNEGVIICTDRLQLVYANRVAASICRRPIDEMEGKTLRASLPEIEGTLFDTNAQRTIVGGEPNSADIPSPFRDGSWLRIQCFLFGRQLVILFRDITEEVKRHRLADVKQAIVNAMSLHGDIGYIRTSVRGTIDSVDEPFSRMVGIPDERLIGVHVLDLVMREGRAAFRHTMEQVARTNQAEVTYAQFLTNSGELVTLKVVIVPLQGSYGAEGTVMVLTRPQIDGESG